MYIENDTKLDFDDVLIRPKRSTLRSRADVSLIKTYSFYHSDCSFSGIPIVAANMDHVGTFQMAKALSSHNLFTAIHKFYSLDEWKDFIQKNKTTLSSCYIFAFVLVSYPTRIRQSHGTFLSPLGYETRQYRIIRVPTSITSSSLDKV